MTDDLTPERLDELEAGAKRCMGQHGEDGFCDCFGCHDILLLVAAIRARDAIADSRSKTEDGESDD